MNTQLVRRTGRMPSVFDDFFSSPLHDWFNGGLSARLVHTPLVNTSERQDDYLVSLAAPGLKKEDFKIEIEGNLLCISSEKEESEEEEQDQFTRREYSYSSFERSFTLPEDVDREKIAANYKEGILEIILPKKEEARRMAISKNIEVK